MYTVHCTPVFKLVWPVWPENVPFWFFKSKPEKIYKYSRAQSFRRTFFVPSFVLYIAKYRSKMHKFSIGYRLRVAIWRISANRPPPIGPPASLSPPLPLSLCVPTVPLTGPTGNRAGRWNFKQPHWITFFCRPVHHRDGWQGEGGEDGKLLQSEKTEIFYSYILNYMPKYSSYIWGLSAIHMYPYFTHSYLIVHVSQYFCISECICCWDWNISLHTNQTLI